MAQKRAPSASVNKSPAPGSISLSLVIPVYNESQRISLTFAALLDKVDWGVFRLAEIIFVNDGSTDKTLSILRKGRANLCQTTGADVIVLTYGQNHGKGYAIRTGMLAASSKYILMMDADMSTPLTEVARLQTGVRHCRPIIIGTRKSRVVRVEKEQPPLRVFMGRAYTQLAQSILNTYVSDFTCGFKLFRQDAAREIFGRALIDRWSYDSEIMFLAVRLGYRPLEVAVRWHNDERSRVNLVRDTWRSFTDLWRIRFYQLTKKYDLPEKIGRGNRKNRSSETSC